MVQNILVGGVAEGYGPQVVLVHELVEEVGTEHHGLGNLYGSIREVVELRMTLDDVVKEGKATPFATQRAVANAGKVGIAVELEGR